MADVLSAARGAIRESGTMTSKRAIIIRGARQHNLKNIDLQLPRNQLTVITGLSGSGKSTLAFDTLYAEGQRRYVESISAYARQFLERLEKPDVDLIDGLSPAIAIEQKTASFNPRSTVGTVTEIYDYLRLLYARVGQPHCHRCGRPITSWTIDQMVDQLLSLKEGSRIVILAPLALERKVGCGTLFNRLKKQGFARVQIDGVLMDLDEVGSRPARPPRRVEVVIDRLIVQPSTRKRLTDSLELALAQGNGNALVEVDDGRSLRFNETPACQICGIHQPELTPVSFSFNSPHGACPRCSGLGSTAELDPELVIPDPRLSLHAGAVAVWARRTNAPFIDFLEALTTHYGTTIHTPIAETPESFQRVLLHGSGAEAITSFFDRGPTRVRFQRPFEGIIPNLERRYRETGSQAVREEIKRFMRTKVCPECGGAKLNPASRAVTLQNISISALCAMTIVQTRRFCQELVLDGQKQRMAHGLLREIVGRLQFLEDVGLSYLTLDRSAQTLSGGESQRIRLATQIGSQLTGVLYVLDEPSIGLHPRDHRRLLETLLRLRDLGNTVLVVEHDEATIRAADYVVDMGPGGGIQGGWVVFAGPPARLLEEPASLTGGYLSGRMTIDVPARRRLGSGLHLVLEGATQNNLKNITVAFPLGCLIGVTGVSGSGKSSLVSETLYPAVFQRLHRSRLAVGSHRRIAGIEHIHQVVHIDQSPIGRTPRSNPGTYSGIFNFIRDLFARTPEARMRGYNAGRFSFNVKGGRCEACQGDGTLKIEMHFLPDVYVTCDGCGGRRYNRETLEVQYKGRSIADVLAMTVDEGLQFFGRIGQIREKLQTLSEVGLGYVAIGQAATTLSGGEAQRVKLSRELSRKGTGRTLYVLDEPTTGLHSEDIRRLLVVLNQLVDAGHTVVIIEHNLDVIKTADYLVDLGPGAGADGGQVVGCGTPEDLAANPRSWTGQYLKPVLQKRETRSSDGSAERG
jgi:excinuclease ABC subunit A